MAITNFPNGVSSFGMPVLPNLGGMVFTGTAFFVDPANGSDANTGLNPGEALKTLYKAHAKMTSGKNDVCYLIGDGTSTATARLSLALAQSVDSTATVGTLVWSKNACHLVGVAAPNGPATRARIAPPTGTYTAATFASNDFVSVTATGCVFCNFSIQDVFSTGNAAQRCWVDSGGRNFYSNVHINGISTAAAAGSANSRSLVLTGTTGENTFSNCIIGGDTVTRGNFANANLELASGSPRNRFIDCTFLAMCSGAGPLFVVVGESGMDRFVVFDRCKFINPVKSTSTAMTVAMSFNAATGGLALISDSMLVGVTDWGDAAAFTQQYLQGAYATNTTGLGANPT